MWELRQIIVDDPGKTGDGSDAEIHSESIFKGSEIDIRIAIHEEDITDWFNCANATMPALKRIAGANGYILRKVN